jgi:UDP-GlcNAc:undecaprenyl-phosphate GlcNAc-1-phosphate transferase
MVKVIYYYFSYFGVSLALALLLVPLMRTLAFRVGAVDKGEGRRVHRGVVPRLGGVGIFLAFVIPFGFSLTRGEWDLFHGNMVGILIASSIVFLIGCYDDLKGALVSNKLLAEIIAAALIYAWGIRIDVISNPLGGGPISLGWLSLPSTILWIIIITNAINLIDGLDGLAAGTGIFISLTFFILSGSDFHLRLTYAVLAGSLLGFLRYNFPPASIFMGDSGSLFLGFFLGATSIISAHKATAFVTVMIPIVAFGLPLMDMFYAVLRRYYRGVPLGEADKEHIHHKLLEKGLSKRKVLLVLYAINIGIMLGTLLLIGRRWKMDLLGLILLIILTVFGLRLLGYIKFVPFVKDLLRGHTINRKRKYFSYVISRFRQRAEKSGSFEDLWAHLTDLIKEYNFSYVEIYLDIPSIKNPAYVFRGSEARGNSMMLSFPIFNTNERYMGDVSIFKKADDDYFLCTAEMVRAISEEIVWFTEKQGVSSLRGSFGVSPSA